MSKHIPNQNCVYINCDGACRGNPGHGAIGIIIKDENKKTVLKEHKEYIGETTNNQAEYRAVIRALYLAKNFTNKKVFIFSDSKLIINQLTGVYKVKDYKLKKLCLEVKKLEKSVQSVKYTHVKREENIDADRLANEILDKVTKK